MTEITEKMKDNGRMLKGIAGETAFPPFFFEIFPDFVKKDVKAEYYYKEPDYPFLHVVIEQECDV